MQKGYVLNYYEIALLKSPLKPLTYQSSKDIKIGTKVEISLRNRKKVLFGVVIQKLTKPKFKCSDIVEVLDFYYDTLMLETSKFIALYYVCSLGEALSLYTAFNHKISYRNTNIIYDTEIILSKQQTKAYEFIGQNKSSLLFANTGSGKTEIYIQCIKDILDKNKQALLLMPEISLTPQMKDRLEVIFGTKVAIWHSKIQKKKKEDILNKLLSGEIKIIAGARSSLFLPYNDLGLIIVDEEHDESYKSDAKPRLNVKDLCLYMSKKYDIKLILGSATPSISSYSKVPYFRLSQTYHRTQKHISFDESNLSINNTVISKIQNTLNAKKQVIVFLPTRANFKYQICSSCNKSIECPFCSVSLSLHKQNKALMCHYCNYTQAIPNQCPSCKTGIIKNFRLGTAEAEEILQNYFSQHIVKRFDTNTVNTTTKLKKILKEFNENKIDVLVGTQMLSKGHDYHNVTLAVILGIDSVLNMSSYKTREKTLSLTLQIAGRSGRNGFGEVLIQSKNKDFLEKYLTQNDYEDFLKEELVLRSDIYPPNIRLAKVIFSHTNALIAKKELDFYIQKASSITSIELVGFKECSVFKIANKYRYELLLRSKDINAMLNFLHSINCAFASIDMDTLH
jgi:primosomal protein N' (replication factor Y)